MTECKDSPEKAKFRKENVKRLSECKAFQGNAKILQANGGEGNFESEI